MADPRLSVNWAGAHAQYMLCKATTGIAFAATSAGGSTKVGLAVTLTGNSGLISTAADAEAVFGKLIKVEQDLMCTVQVGGAMTLPGGTGATLVRGKKIVGDLLVSAEGYVREAATAVAAELGVMRGYIMDAADSEAVWVWL